MKFRKRPVVIEAVQFTGKNAQEIVEFIGKLTGFGMGPDWAEIEIPTLEGMMRASKGDWIIKGVNGEFYPCKPDIFAKTYEAVDDSGFDSIMRGLKQVAEHQAGLE